MSRAKFDELRPASADTTVPVNTAKSIEKRIERVIGCDERIEVERTLFFFFKKKEKPLASTGGRGVIGFEGGCYWVAVGT